MSNKKRRLEEEARRLEKDYGRNTASMAHVRHRARVIPTGSLALDYALGTGGWVMRNPVEVFGPPDIGKSSVLGLGAIASAQRLDLGCGIIATEPNFDPAWAEKNGVDPEMLIVARPDDGEDAFHILHEWVLNDLIDVIIFDSVGALLSAGETEEGSKAKAMGQAGLITFGVKRILQPAWKRGKFVMFLNQQRDNTKSPIAGAVESPGGWAIRHSSVVRVHLRQKGGDYKAKVNDDDVTIGRRLVANIIRNKLSEGSRRKAEFDYYLMETEEHPVGIDLADDVVSTAMRTGVITKDGGGYSHPDFPKNKGGDTKLRSKDAVGDYLRQDPSMNGPLQTIRNQVLTVMRQRQGEVKDLRPELEALDGEARV